MAAAAAVVESTQTVTATTSVVQVRAVPSQETEPADIVPQTWPPLLAINRSYSYPVIRQRPRPVQLLLPHPLPSPAPSVLPAVRELSQFRPISKRATITVPCRISYLFRSSHSSSNRTASCQRLRPVLALVLQLRPALPAIRTLKSARKAD